MDEEGISKQPVAQAGQVFAPTIIDPSRQAPLMESSVATVTALEPDELEPEHDVSKQLEEPEEQRLRPKFTGYTPPEKKGLAVFIGRNKMRVGIGLSAFVAATSVLGLMIASSGTKEAVLTSTASVAAESQDDTVEVAPENPPEEVAVAHISDAQFGRNTLGQEYSLETLDGESWLKRSENDWRQFTQWEGWLFFTADRSDGAESGSVGLEVFNFDTQDYLSVAEIKPPKDSDILVPLHVRGEYLYIQFGGPQADGALYRCKLEKNKACVDLELFYDGSGDVHVQDERTLYIIDSVVGRDKTNTTISIYDIKSEELTKVTKISHSLNIGTHFGHIARDGIVWLSEISGDKDLAEDPEYDGFELLQLAAVNPDGTTAFVVPGNAVPIAGALPVQGVTLDANKLLYANDTREVLFNTDTKQFEAPRERRLADEADKKENILDTEVRLDVPKEYLMRISN